MLYSQNVIKRKYLLKLWGNYLCRFGELKHRFGKLKESWSTKDTP